MIQLLAIGIDPGKNGGIAGVLYGRLFSVQRMPTTERELFDHLQSLVLLAKDELRQADERDVLGVRALLENVHSMPKQGIASAFKFGAQYGACRCALAASSIPFEEISPAKWQRAMGCLSGGDKNVTKRRAIELYPAHAPLITHATADATLLAHLNWIRWMQTQGCEMETSHAS